jgi:hypothetical protein
MPAPRRILAAASTAVTTLVLASPAGAATITAPACVPTVQGVGTLPLAGAGFTPGAVVSVRSNPAGVFSSALVDPAGNWTASTSAATFNPFSRQLQTFDLLATDGANPALTAATRFQQVRVGYRTNPQSGSPGRSALHTVRGFPVGKNTYLHFRFGGQTKRNVKLGKTKGACGIVSRRMALLPTQSRPGTWTVYADQKASYSQKTQPQLKYSFVIRRTFG